MTSSQPAHGYYYERPEADEAPSVKYYPSTGVVAGGSKVRSQSLTNTNAPQFGGIRDSCSDTDSGICADSAEAPNSPRRLQNDGYQIPASKSVQFQGDFTHLPNDHFRPRRRPPPVPPRKPQLAALQRAATNHTTTAQQQHQSVAPLASVPVTAVPPNVNHRYPTPPVRDDRRFDTVGHTASPPPANCSRRVRFADEMDSSAAFNHCSSSFNVPRQSSDKTATMPNWQRESASNANGAAGRQLTRQEAQTDRQHRPYFYELDSRAVPGVATNVVPLPPPYGVAVGRLRQARLDTSFDEEDAVEERHSRGRRSNSNRTYDEDEVNHTPPAPPPLRYRSSSLPRNAGRRHPRQPQDSTQRQRATPLDPAADLAQRPLLCQQQPDCRRNNPNVLSTGKSLQNLATAASDTPPRRRQLLRLQVPYELRTQTFDTQRNNEPTALLNPCVKPSSSFNTICREHVNEDGRTQECQPKKKTNTKESSKVLLPRSKSNSRVSDYFSRMKFFSTSTKAENSELDKEQPVQTPASVCSQDRILSHQNCQQVRIKLLGLDHRGVQTIVLEKLEEGPFGFFIATGCFQNTNGIFVSRVSLPSLAPLLTVGDEVMSVDGRSVRGETLEFVQSLIAHRHRIVLQTLPLVNRDGFSIM